MKSENSNSDNSGNDTLTTDAKSTKTAGTAKRPQPAGLAAANAVRRANAGKAVSNVPQTPIDELEPVSAKLELFLMVNVQLNADSVEMRDNDAMLKSGVLAANADQEKPLAVNAFDVFASRGKKHKPKPEGLVRRQMPAIMQMIAEFNGDKATMVLENPDNLMRLLESRASKVAKAVKSLLLPQNLQYGITLVPKEGEDIASPSEKPKTIEDYIHISSFVNELKGDADAIVDTYVGAICITVTVPNLVDPYEALQKIVDKSLKRESDGVTLLLLNTITTDAEAEMPEVAEAKAKLLTDVTGRAAYSYSRLTSAGDDYFWVPHSKELLEKAITPINGLVYAATVRPSALKSKD